MCACHAFRESLDPRAVEALIRCLGDADTSVRCTASFALRPFRDARALEPLIKCLGDYDGNVRRHACDALGLLKDSRAVEPLIKCLDDSEQHVRDSAYEALGEIGNPRPVELLIERLGCDDSDARRSACNALGEIGDPRAVEPLIGRLSDRDSSVLYNACRALGKIADPRAVAPLIEQMGIRDGVSRWAGEALAALGEERLSEALAGAIEGDGDALRELSEMGRSGDVRAVDPLAKSLGDERGDHRGICLALTAVSRGFGPQASKALCRICLTRFRKETTKHSALVRAEYYVCRSCGKACHAELNVRAVAVLDRRASKEVVWRDGEAIVNWLKHRKLFDFDRVEIADASDEDVQRFAVQVGNDTDQYRRKRCRQMPVTIAPGCRIEENTLRILQGMFGEILRG